MARKSKLKIWQDDEGKWCCSSPELPSSWAVGDTPDAAVKGCEAMLADFNQMREHFKATCPEGCRWCKDHPELKGIQPPSVRFRS
jgi:hypothetical protein